MPSRSIAITHRGHRRTQNQDAIFADDGLGLWLVADGMGGHAGGAVASDIARNAVTEAIAGGAGTAEAVQRAHRKILDAQIDNPALEEMGTTVVGVRDCGDTYEIFWVGDSRVYRLSPGDETPQLLTHDHNLAGLLVENGTLSADEARFHPQRHMLTECLGFVGRDTVRCDLRTEPWRPGDILLLCSDGLSNELDGERIRAIIQRTPDLSSAADALVEAALEAGGRDNISIILVTAPTGTRSVPR